MPKNPQLLPAALACPPASSSPGSTGSTGSTGSPDSHYSTGSAGSVPRQRFFVPPGAPFLEIRTTLDSPLPYAEHVHSAFSLGLILQGRTRFTLDGVAYTAEAGDIVLIAQGSAHCCNPVDGPRGYHMLLIDARWLHARMGHELLLCPPLIRDAALFAQAEAVMQALLADREQAAEMLADLLQEVRGRHGRAGVNKREAEGKAGGKAGGRCPLRWPELCAAGDTEGERGGNAMRGMGGAEGAFLSVAGLARAAGMRRESFSRAVRRTTGLPPSRYLHCLRLDKARSLLRQGHSIIEAALAAGYADQSHFHRMFVKFYAVTPGRYRACHIRTRNRR